MREREIVVNNQCNEEGEKEAEKARVGMNAEGQASDWKANLCVCESKVTAAATEPAHTACLEKKVNSLSLSGFTTMRQHREWWYCHDQHVSGGT